MNEHTNQYYYVLSVYPTQVTFFNCLCMQFISNLHNLCQWIPSNNLFTSALVFIFFCSHFFFFFCWLYKQKHLCMVRFSRFSLVVLIFVSRMSSHNSELRFIFRRLMIKLYRERLPRGVHLIYFEKCQLCEWVQL